MTVGMLANYGLVSGARHLQRQAPAARGAGGYACKLRLSTRGLSQIRKAPAERIGRTPRCQAPVATHFLDEGASFIAAQ